MGPRSFSADALFKPSVVDAYNEGSNLLDPGPIALPRRTALRFMNGCRTKLKSCGDS
jgi:hypothetical protein